MAKTPRWEPRTYSPRWKRQVFRRRDWKYPRFMKERSDCLWGINDFRGDLPFLDPLYPSCHLFVLRSDHELGREEEADRFRLLRVTAPGNSHAPLQRLAASQPQDH